MRNFKLIATSVLAILVAILVVQGTGRNAPTICNSRHASRDSAFHGLRGRIRAWSPSHYVAEDKRVRTYNEAHGSIRLVRFADIFAFSDQAIDAVGDSLIFYFLRRRIPHAHGKEADPLRELPQRSAELSTTIWPRRNAPPLDRNVFAFDSGLIWPVSVPLCPSFSVFCAARLISSIFLSSIATIG
jgi:hypothetical protein